MSIITFPLPWGLKPCSWLKDIVGEAKIIAKTATDNATINIDFFMINSPFDNKCGFYMLKQSLNSHPVVLPVLHKVVLLLHLLSTPHVKQLILAVKALPKGP
jgi:hypothetical protein